MFSRKVSPRAPRGSLFAAAVAMSVTFAPATSRAAGLLDFELTPANAAPNDNDALTAAYAVPGGSVKFYFDTNGDNAYTSGTDVNPDFEQAGDDNITGFASTYTGVPDTARPGYAAQLGRFFLRHPGGAGFALPGPFIADYDSTTAIRELSGEIWDIDGPTPSTPGFEQWQVDVLSTSGSVLATELSPVGINPSDPASLDSLPWTFAFRGLPDGVDKLRLTYIGTKVGVGLAFNNFSPTVALPEPATAIAGISALVLMPRRRRAVNARG